MYKSSLIFMVEPHSFYMNEKTIDNAYQHRDSLKPVSEIKTESDMAKREHAGLRDKISAADVKVLLAYGPEEKPDAIFPNNSFSVHEKNGQVIAILYPMSPGRRDELPKNFINFLKGISGNHFHDLRHYAKKGWYLEGTGVLNFNAEENVIFISRSQRASEEVLPDVAKILDIEKGNIFVFDSLDQEGEPIYHTNVMSWVGEGIIGICLNSIRDGDEKDRLSFFLKSAGYKILDLDYAEINAFAGNALEVLTMRGDRALTLSQAAWDGLTQRHKSAIAEHYGDKVIIADIGTIERLGGGSVRCTQAKADLSPDKARGVIEKFAAMVHVPR